jgi:hypothetical protein
MATPSLLDLPRELRDILYGYLHQEIETEWPWSTYTGCPGKLTFKNAPLPSLLFVHSQLHAEYLEADCFRKPCTILDLCEINDIFDPDSDSNFDCEGNEDKNEHPWTYGDRTWNVGDLKRKARVFSSVFAHALELRVFIKMRFDSAPPNVFWLGVEHPIVAMIFRASHLTVIHIALQVVQGDCLTPEGDSPPVVGTDENTTDHEHPANAVAGLHLNRYGHGHQVGFGVLLSPRLGRRIMFTHYVASFGAYTFTKEGQSAQLWIPGKEEGRMMDIYTADALSVLPEESREMVARWPFEIQDWTEICEADIGSRAG